MWKLGILSLLFSQALAQCSFQITPDLKEPQVLVLKATGTEAIDAFYLPDNSGVVHFTAGQAVTFACPGGAVSLGGTSSGTDVKTGTCSSGKAFTVDGTSRDISTITCTKNVVDVAKFSGNKCLSTYDEAVIGFDVAGRFITNIRVCFDKVAQNSLYSTFDMSKTIGGYQVAYPRPSFKEGTGFYNLGSEKLDTLYTRARQTITVNELLGYPADDTTYIHPTNDYFLARGHLTAKTDVTYGSQQNTTFYFINVVPQWQTMNAGNWLNLEDSVQTYAPNKGLNLVVYSGPWDTLKLPHATTGTLTSIYLYNPTTGTKGVPVPGLTWKVVYDPNTTKGTAFVTVNNPYDTNPTKVCTDICNQISWISWKPTDQKLGISYCCTVDDLRSVVKNVPSFPVSGLLT